MIATVTKQPIIKLLTTQEEVSAVRSALQHRVLEMERNGEAAGDKGTGPAADYKLLQNVLLSLDKVWNDKRLYERV